MENTSNFLIFGGAGRLARALVQTCPTGVFATALSRQTLDLTDADAVRAAVRTFRPKAVINAAAWTDVSGAQTHPEEAYAVNAHAPGRLAEILREEGVELVHYSTDYVFSGNGSMPWSEENLPAPRAQGVYGLSKALGEEKVLASRVAGVVIRAGWLHSGERDFVAAILRAALAGRSLTVTRSQIGTPTHTSALAAWTWKLLLQFGTTVPMKVVHYVEEGGWISRAEFADYVLKRATEQCERLGQISRGRDLERIRTSMRVVDDDDGIRPLNCRLKTVHPYLPSCSHWRLGVDKSVEIVINSELDV